jgi:hypothetical protein
MMELNMVWMIILGLFILFVIVPFKLRNQFDWTSNRFPLITRSLSKKKKEILIRYSKFYGLLPPKSKLIFENRVAHFLARKTFVPRKLREVSTEMKVCISAAAIQLIFGLPTVELSHFKFILVYPDEYYSTITKKYHKGEVNPRHRAIVVSWKAFVEGFALNEGINLGLHEMAHALHLENNIRNGESDFLSPHNLSKWDELASMEIESLRNNSNTFFRNYAGTDNHEFFAVAIENFFERPKAFIAYNAELYQCLAALLNQNPLLLSNEMA